MHRASVSRPAHGLALGLLLAALAAGSTEATPVVVYADAATDYGFDPVDVAAAIAAGADEPTPVSGLGDGDGYFTVTTPDGIPGSRGRSKGNPSKGSSIWTLTVDEETPAELLQGFHLVVLGHDPNDPLKYKTGNVGLEIDTEAPWVLVTPQGGGPTYLAFQLGDLEAGGTYQIPMEYRVGQRLKKKNGVFTFPRYAIAYLSVPEPSTIALAFGAIALGLVARRTR